MELVEGQFLSEEEPPKYCSYCDDEKDFLMVKPTAFKYKKEHIINVNMTKKPLWMCLECFSIELDGMGVPAYVQEYEREEE